jgi:hypothetical protein
MVPTGTIVPKHNNSKGKNRYSKQQAVQAEQPKKTTTDKIAQARQSKARA